FAQLRICPEHIAAQVNTRRLREVALARLRWVTDADQLAIQRPKQPAAVDPALAASPRAIGNHTLQRVQLPSSAAVLWHPPAASPSQVEAVVLLNTSAARFIFAGEYGHPAHAIHHDPALRIERHHALSQGKIETVFCELHNILLSRSASGSVIPPR